MGLRPGPRQQAGREVTPLGDPGGETAKSRARPGSLKGVAPKCSEGVSAGGDGDKCAVVSQSSTLFSVVLVVLVSSRWVSK